MTDDDTVIHIPSLHQLVHSLLNPSVGVRPDQATAGWPHPELLMVGSVVAAIIGVCLLGLLARW